MQFANQDVSDDVPIHPSDWSAFDVYHEKTFSRDSGKSITTGIVSVGSLHSAVRPGKRSALWWELFSTDSGVISRPGRRFPSRLCKNSTTADAASLHRQPASPQTLCRLFSRLRLHSVLRRLREPGVQSREKSINMRRRGCESASQGDHRLWHKADFGKAGLGKVRGTGNLTDDLPGQFP